MLHKYRRQLRNLLPLLLILSINILLTRANYVSMTVSTSNTQINTASTYTFQINRGYDPVNFAILNPTAVPINTVIIITFPSQFITLAQTSTLPCTNTDNGQSLTCNVNTVSRKITITNYYSSSTTTSNKNLNINIQNVINSYIAETSGNFQWQIIDSNNNVIDQGPLATSNQQSTGILFTPAIFQSCVASASGNLVSSDSPITLTLTPSNAINSLGQLIVLIPLAWTSDPLAAPTLKNNPICTGVTGITGTVSCSYSKSSQQVITISGLTIGSLSTTFSVLISNILVPPTVNSIETISIYSQWSTGIQIDTCTTSIKDAVAAPFQPSTTTFTSKDNTIVQSSFTGTLKLTLSRTFYYQDSIVMTLPSQFTSTQVSSANFANFVSNLNLNTLTLSSFPSNPNTLASGSVIIFTMSTLKNPFSTVPINLIVSIYRNNQLYQQSTLTYSAVATTITSFSISAISNFVYNSGTATFTITSGLTIPSGSKITITYPMTVSNIATKNIQSGTLDGNSVANGNYQVNNNQIIFSNIFTSNFAGTTILSINDFINPSTIQPSAYLIVLADSAGYNIMTGSYSFTASTKALISNTVSASSVKVLDTGVTYTISIKSNYAFTSVSIVIPSDITVGSSYSSTCVPSTFSSCSLSGSTLTFIGSQIAGSYSLSWGYNTNPNSMQSTGPFMVSTYQQGWGVQNSLGVINLAMTTANSFSSYTVSPSSFVNSALISITFALSLPSNSPNGKITITFPSQLSITTATCTSCTVVPPYIYINVASNTANVNLVVSNVNNVGSYKPISSITVSLASNAGFGSLFSTTPGWTNNLPSSFTTTVSGGNNFRGQANTFLFQITGLSGAQSNVQITIPSAFGALSSAPTGATLLSPYKVQQPCTGTSCTFNFILTNPTSPLSSTFTFSLVSFTSDGFQVGISTSNSWTFDCQNTNCRSCLANSNCLTCYSSLLSSYYFFNTASGQCISQCTTGFFFVNSICSPCDSNCVECSTTSKYCTSCPLNNYLQSIRNTCVGSCITGYFANSVGKTCDLCAPPCATCTGTSTNCLSCIQNNYLLSHSCLSTCTPSYYINNPVTGICDPCNSNCLTCTSQTTNCLTCNNALPLYFQNNVCVPTCSANYFLVNNICTFCASPCKTCTGAINVCASCLPSSPTPIYYNQGCILATNCPIGRYVDFTTSSCELCPTNCVQCTSLTVCSVCSPTYYLYGQTCQQTCPTTTYKFVNSITNICQTCNNCDTCSSSTTCTSCVLSKYLYTGICYATCPSGTFASASGCTICIANCPTCQNLTYCNSCVQSMNLYQGTCSANCPSGTYVNTIQQICINCPPSCMTCVSNSSCQSCATNYSLENSQCVLACSQGVSLNQICLACGLHCSICTVPPCSLCDTNFYLYNKICNSQCPVNMLSLDGRTCVLCTQKFENCTTCTLAQCLSCNYGQLSNGTCRPCSAGTYTDSTACSVCPSACATCLNQTYCFSCSPNNYILNNICSSTCPQNMYPSGTRCSFCADGCSVCNTTTTLCSVCSPGIYLYNHQCHTICPNSMVVSLDFLNCVTQEVYYQQFSKASKIVPFPFTIASGTLIIVGLLLNWFFKEMHLRTVLCAIVSFIELASWAIFLTFEYIYYSNYHFLSLYGAICSSVAIVLLYLLNMLHLRFYVKYISEDMQFVRWSKKYCSTNITMIIFSSSFTFKFYRFVHSKFLGRENLSMMLSSSNRLIPFSLLSVLSIFLCSTPIVTGCALALYNSISQDQQFFIALDTIVVTGIMILLMLMDLHHPADYFISEHETKNIGKKVYQVDEIRFDRNQDDNPLEENASNENLIHLQEDQGQMSLPSSANKLQSTFLKTKTGQNLKLDNKNQSLDELGAQTNIKPIEVQNIEDIEQQQESEIVTKEKAKWMPKTYDHHGYLIKYDANNNPIKYDQNGYRIEIDEEGVHHRYNELGQEMIEVNGQYIPIDKDGYRLKNGKRYDARGYQVRQQNQGIAFYQQHGFKVIQDGDKQKLIDQNGNTVVIDEDGTIHRYQQDGLQIVEHKGKLLLMDKDGNYVKKDKDGVWKAYDPQDGFYLKKNAISGQVEKYDDLGFRVVCDKFGNMHRYDEEGYHVTVLPGGVIVRHDDSGYRIEKDEHGNIHRYDKDGFQVITDKNGNIKFIDSNGYTVQRDLYGRVSLFDENGYLVVIDDETGGHRRFTQEGLEVFTDIHGNVTLKDKRGHIVKELEGDTYEKYDEQGNKIYLDENGYEVEEDSDENIVRYDKVGDLVQTSFDIRQDDDQFFESTLIGGNNKSKPLKYKYKPPCQQINHQQQLNQLMHNQLFIYDEDQSQISELKEFHDDVQPVKQIEVEQELMKIVNKQRNQLMFLEETDTFEQVQNFDVIKNSCYDHIAQPKNEEFTGLQAIAQNEEAGLIDKELNKQTQFDNQLIIAQDGVDTPNIDKVGLENANRSLADRQLNNQPEYDKEALVRQIDDNQPDVLAIKKQNELMMARQNALRQSLVAHPEQQYISIKSVADISIDERSFDNQGVQPLQNRTQYDQINSLDEMMDLPMGRNKRGGRSEMSFVNARKVTQTVYNYNTVEVEIKNNNNNQNLYDEDEQIESLHEQEWQEQLNPMQFTRKQKAKNEEHSSNANTHILYIEDDQDNKDTLSQFVNNTQNGSKMKMHRYQNHDMLSGKGQSIEQIEQQLFQQMNNRGVRERREFKLSGAPNPLVQYAKNIEAHKKSLQQKMYLDQTYK